MISVQSLTDNLVPNVYVKNLSLNSTYTGTVLNKKKAGYYDPNNPSEEMMALGDQSMTNLSLTMKLIKNKKTKDQLIHLLYSELSDYIKIYVHQVTDKNLYQNMLKDMDKFFLTTDWTNVKSTQKNPNIETKVFNYDNFWNAQDATLEQKSNEENLDDGTILIESHVETTFNFKNDSSFLSYIIVPVIKNAEDLGDEIILGKASADIILLDGKFQNEGMVFTIAPFPAGSNTVELSKFGKPGDMWGGAVHFHASSGVFMAGAKHTNQPHPRLEYQIVPITKFVDNRVGDRIEKNILNITQTFEKVNSSITRYKNSGLNLLDFESYKRTSFISEIFLSDDGIGNINGFFSIDKATLIKKNSAFPFLFDNIQHAFEPNTASAELKNLLNAAALGGLRVYQDGNLLDVNSSDFNMRQEGDLQANPNQTGIEYYSFKKKSNDLGAYKFRVEVEYKDPTVEYVKDILNLLKPAQDSINAILKRLEISIPTEAGIWESGYNEVTKRISEKGKNVLLNEQTTGIVTSGQQAGAVIAVEQFINDPKSFIYFYNNRKVKTAFLAVNEYELFKNYIRSLSNIETATSDTLLLLAKFFNNLRNMIEKGLDSVGIKESLSMGGTGEENLYGKDKTKGDVFSSREKRMITASSMEEQIVINDRGYDFTAFIRSGNQNLPDITTGRDNSHFLQITKDDYKAACEHIMLSLASTSVFDLNQAEAASGSPNLSNVLNSDTAVNVGFDAPYMAKVSNSAYSFLSIPADFIKSCVTLPSTVVDMASSKVNIENIFTSILKYNSLLWQNNNVGNHKTQVRKDLDTILGKNYGAYLPLMRVISEQSTTTAGTGNNASQKDNSFGIGSPIDPPTLPPNTSGQPSQGADPYSVPKIETEYTVDWKEQHNNNFLLFSLLNRLLLSRKYSFRVPMSKTNFTPYSYNGTPEAKEEGYVSFLLQHKSSPDTSGFTVNIPLQVQTLSIQKGESSGPFFDFSNDKKYYINKNVINPLLLCYYWFLHQNIVKVEYLSGYEESLDIVGLKNNDNPYVVDQSAEIKTRELKKPVWKTLDNKVINQMQAGKKVLCRISRYRYPYYIDNNLVKALDLPLINNYFIIQG